MKVFLNFFSLFSAFSLWSQWNVFQHAKETWRFKFLRFLLVSSFKHGPSKFAWCSQIFDKPRILWCSHSSRSFLCSGWTPGTNIYGIFRFRSKTSPYTGKVVFLGHVYVVLFQFYFQQLELRITRISFRNWKK